jgi:hypothetical protein
MQICCMRALFYGHYLSHIPIIYVIDVVTLSNSNFDYTIGGRKDILLQISLDNIRDRTIWYPNVLSRYLTILVYLSWKCGSCLLLIKLLFCYSSRNVINENM